MRIMSDNRDEKEGEITTKYIMRFFYEESMISGFLHKRIIRIRDLIKAWRSEKESLDKDNPDRHNVER